MTKYEDIISLPHRVSQKHKPMPIRNRAAQFASFAALSGYEDVINETARLTDSKRELSESECAVLNRKLNYFMDNIGLGARIVYFVRDRAKPGGEYHTITGSVKRIDEFSRELIFTNGTSVPINDIVEINCEQTADE